jgi:hypothetical protein
VSSRVLRDDLWTSEPIGRLHDKTFRLYVCLINAADDYGLVDTGFGEISRAAPLTRWSPEEVQKMLGEMFDSEVLLPYRVHAKSYCAVDKWQCFMRSVKPKHPIPSFGLGHIRMPYGFKNQRVREAASLLLRHLDIKGIPQGVPRDDLGHEGSKEEGNREEGKKKEISSSSSSVDTVPTPSVGAACPVEKIRGLWNSIVAAAGGQTAMNLSKARRELIVRRWREVGPESVEEGLAWFEALFRDHVAASKFCTGKVPGRDGRPFRIGIDTVFRSEQQLDQIAEGKYA